MVRCKSVGGPEFVPGLRLKLSVAGHAEMLLNVMSAPDRLCEGQQLKSDPGRPDPPHYLSAAASMAGPPRAILTVMSALTVCAKVSN